MIAAKAQEGIKAMQEASYFFDASISPADRRFGHQTKM